MKKEKDNLILNSEDLKDLINVLNNSIISHREITNTLNEMECDMSEQIEKLKVIQENLKNLYIKITKCI